MVVIEGRHRNVWKGEWSISCLDLHLMSCGAACAMVHSWLLDMHSTLFEGSELPKIVTYGSFSPKILFSFDCINERLKVLIIILILICFAAF